ncbi:hypothetical protein WG622_09880 [Cognatishimia sp. D5M38]|uniref:Uncharacterized protein n=1 Tax=Cognatishimia coralii TaxID=3083254 RepID=A0ABU8QGK2_9RHOB
MIHPIGRSGPIVMLVVPAIPPREVVWVDAGARLLNHRMSAAFKRVIGYPFVPEDIQARAVLRSRIPYHT